MRITSCLLLGIVLCLPAAGFAQEAGALPQSLELVFKDLRPADKKTLVEEGAAVWSSSFLTQADKDTVNALFQEMRDLRLTPAGELRNFISCINSFGVRGEKENFEVWLKGMEKAMCATDKRRTLVKQYLESTRQVACDNLLFSGASHKWAVGGSGKWIWGDPIRVDYEGVNLMCCTPKDTIRIQSTGGQYAMESGKWRGRGGHVQWWVGDSLSADLAGYTVDLGVSEYTADSVVFHYAAKYTRPILGQLKDNAAKYARTKNKEFPYFMSYATNIKIDSIFPYANFEGGIIHAGMKFSGYGKNGAAACIHVQPNDTLNIYVFSDRFTIDSARVMAATSRFVVDMDSGTLSHPNVNFTYMKKNRTLTVKRLTDQSLQEPFRDDFHKILFGVEQIVWPIDSSYMEMSMNSRSGLFKAQVESLNFFSDNVYDNMQKLDDMHPLNALHKASVEFGSNTFTLTDFAGLMKKPKDQLRKELIMLSYNDFLEYDEKNDEVTLKPRLFAYTEARVGKRDYDNIRFDSHPPKGTVNAILDLRNYNMKLFGVEKFTISQTKDIYVEPSGQTVVMMKNRDMEFDGKLKAGMFDMFGTKLFFSYNRYTVDLTHVDSTGMYLTDLMTKKRGERINSLIRDVTGDIVIDKPDNKSGRKVNPDFPIFHSTKDSYVYFDDPEIQHGVYKRDSFFFIIRPYTLKNIDDASKFRYAFSGTMVSNIVQDINDTLILMHDNALGMRYRTPETGLPLYVHSNLKSLITLDQTGFRADGDVAMNSSYFSSKDILMTPDSMMTETKRLQVDSLPDRRPSALGEDVAIKYFRADNNLTATSRKVPFGVYGGRIRHSGELFVYDDHLNAAGRVDMEGAILNSKLYRFHDHNILSDHTDLRLVSIGNQNIQLNTANVKADIDLALNKGKFENNEDANKADFPSNKYKCSFKSFVWYMKEVYLNIGIEDELTLQHIWQIDDETRIPEKGRNVFLSTNRLCDSLTFIAPLARYNLETGEIACSYVNHIDLANGRFFPDEGKIFIASNGDIQEFKKGRFLCEMTDKTKTLTEVDLKLKGRYEFNGSGDFDYINQDRKRNVIRFTEIRIDTSRHIYARVNMPDSAKFDLNQGFLYKGRITMFSKQKHLYYDGYVGLTAEKEYLKHNWLKVKTYFVANDVRVPVKVENGNDRNGKIYNGVYLHVDKTVKPYATFLSNRQFYNDDLFIGGEGEMVWSRNERKYIITNPDISKEYKMVYDPSDNSVSAFGHLNMAMRIPGVEQDAAGDIRFNLKENTLNINNALYVIDMTLLPKMESVMLRDFADKKLKGLYFSPELRSRLTSMFGPQRIVAVNRQIDRGGNNVPDSLGHTLVLDSLSMQWDVAKRTLVADGKATLVASLQKPISREMNVKMELQRRRVGNVVRLYLYDDRLWYYFELADKSLYTLSSNAEYNEAVKSEKADKKEVRNAEKELLYTITLCPDSKRNRFLGQAKAGEATEEEKTDVQMEGTDGEKTEDDKEVKKEEAKPGKEGKK